MSEEPSFPVDFCVEIVDYSEANASGCDVSPVPVKIRPGAQIIDNKLFNRTVSDTSVALRLHPPQRLL